MPLRKGHFEIFLPLEYENDLVLKCILSFYLLSNELLE